MAPTIAAPCGHNNWENVRIRRKIATLRCRVCQNQFKLSYVTLKKARCHGFAAGSCKVTGCPLLHIYASKQSLVERVEIHGEALLENVPELDRPKENEAAASLSAASSTSTEPSEAVVSTRRASMRAGETITKTLHFVHEDGSIEEYEYECAVDAGVGANAEALYHDCALSTGGLSSAVSQMYSSDDEDIVSVAPYYTPTLTLLRAPACTPPRAFMW